MDTVQIWHQPYCTIGEIFCMVYGHIVMVISITVWCTSLPVMTAINNDHPNHGSLYPSITWLTEVTEQSFMALIKNILLHCSGSKQTTEIQQDIIVISRVWGGPPTSRSPVSQSGCQDPRYEGLAIMTKTRGIGLLYIIREVDDDK